MAIETVIPAPSVGPGQAVDSASIHPEDQYEDLPQLTEELKHEIAMHESPFVVLNVRGPITSEKFKDKEYWIAVLALGDEALFTAFFSRQDDRYDRWAEMKFLLDSGAAMVGPWVLRAIETDKGHPFYKPVVYRPGGPIKFVKTGLPKPKAGALPAVAGNGK